MTFTGDSISKPDNIIDRTPNDSNFGWLTAEPIVLSPYV